GARGVRARAGVAGHAPTRRTPPAARAGVPERRGFVTRRRRLSAAAMLLGVSACADAPAGPTPGRPVFDGEPALELVRTQVDFGPRVPGTEGHARQLSWMIARLDSLTPDVRADTFPWVTTTGD